MSKYKCDNHKIDLVCRGCVKAWIARHDAMLSFIKDIITDGRTIQDQEEATELLKEIGEIK